jgi:hypothetical protein
MSTVAAIDYRSPEHSDRKLSGVQFLQSRDVPFFNELLVQIRSMAPEGDHVDQFLPDANAMGAWDRAYSIYTALKRKPVRTEGRADNSYSQVTNKAWCDYLVQHVELSELVGRQINEATYRYLGLQPDDLQSPTDNGGYTDSRYRGRHPDWGSRAERIASALRTWRALSHEDKRRLPLVFAINDLLQRVAALEAQNSTKQTRSA